jgi:hypothetical protein
LQIAFHTDANANYNTLKLPHKINTMKWQQMINKPQLCFVIAPIGKENSPERRRSDQVLNHIITPAASACGYETIRADKISEPGLITSQVIQHVVSDPLVVADLTGWNPNVFYELALRHAVKKPVVQIINASEAIPFDVASSRTVQLDHRDLDSAARAKEEIIKQIRAVEQNPSEVDNPISVAIDLQFLRQSDNPLEQSNAEIMSQLQELKKGVDQILDLSNAADLRRKDNEWMDQYNPMAKRLFPILDIALKTPEMQALQRLGNQKTIPSHTAPDGSPCPSTEARVVAVGPPGKTDTLKCIVCSTSIDQ